MAINSKALSQKYYKILLNVDEIDVVPAIKIPILKSILEKEILVEITGIDHFYDKFSNGTKIKDGQKGWLLNNKYKDKDRYGTPKSGTIRSDIVSGIINLIDLRNVAEHDDINISKADYLGVFALMAKIINYFFNDPIPDGIKNICNLDRIEKEKIIKPNQPLETKTRKPLVKTKRLEKNKILVDNEILNKTINYKGNTIYFKKNNNESFQDFVKKVIEFMFKHSLLSDNEIKLLQTRDYSKKTFGIDFPLLQNDEKKITIEGYCRYWKKIKFGGIYYCCSQWWFGKMSVYEPLFENWMKKIYNEMFEKSGTPVISEPHPSKNLTKSEAKKICIAHGVNISGDFTFASKNKATNTYWANPSIEFLSHDWWLLLNDYTKHQLHVFKIPANSISKKQIKLRADKLSKVDVQIKYEDTSFEDSRSGIRFVSWFKRTISTDL